MQLPSTPGELAAFPSHELRPQATLYRIHRATRGPWWFSSGTPQRFDLAPPLGTCYLAEEALGAFVEAFQHVGVLIPGEEIAARAISALSVPAEIRLADCTSARARAFGVTGESHASIDRDLTHAWAAAFHEAGFGGVRYLVRDDPAQRRVAVAVFGAAGEASWSIRETRPLDEGLIGDAERVFGVLVR